MRFLAILNWKASVNDQSLMLRWVRIELLLFALQKEQSFRQAYHNRWCTKFCEVLWGLRATDTFFFQCLSNQDKKKHSLCTLLWRPFKNWKKKINEKKFLLPELFLVTKPLSNSPAMLTDTTIESGNQQSFCSDWKYKRRSHVTVSFFCV